ncbi:hypothetical protein HPB52_023686 [Rhipicephalus sanguineus]|uniref:Endonuclease/exonuclease/phosphatase domain-containing protein n=1 Tax=Rhipicephalus sanguineus TaxID=34632 RepID=A0A9D4TC33_RHISA|nr:hypothetical protein HPB52_023686 [Rhipicephalus sanguineus]
MQGSAPHAGKGVQGTPQETEEPTGENKRADRRRSPRHRRTRPDPETLVQQGLQFYIQVQIGIKTEVKFEISVQDQTGSRNQKEAAEEAHNQEGRRQYDIIALQEIGCSPTFTGYSVYEGFGQSKVATLVAKAVTAIRHDIDVTDIDHRKANFSYLLGKAEQAAGKQGLVILGDFNAWHKSWGYDRETPKGKALAREADRKRLSLITDHTQPTRVRNSINRDSCPDLAFVKGVREARWENDGETLGSDHCILRIQIETLPIKKCMACVVDHQLREVNSASIKSNNILEAEEVAIALAITHQGKESTAEIVTDSQEA